LKEQPGAKEVFVVVSGTLLRVDARTQRILDRFVPPEDLPFTEFTSGTTSADGRYLVLTTNAPGVVTFDMATRRFGTWLPVPNRRLSKARLTTDNRRILVLDQLGRLLVMKPETGDVVALVSVPPQVFDSLSNRADNRFFVASRDAGALTVIDAASLTVRGEIQTGHGAHDIATTSDLSRGFVVNEYDGTVSCLDMAESSVLKTVKVGRGARYITVSGDDEVVYVSNTNDGSVSALNVASCRVIATVPRAADGERPGAIATTADGRVLMVAGADGKGLYFLDVSIPVPRIVGRVPTISPVSAIACAPFAASVQRARR